MYQMIRLSGKTHRFNTRILEIQRAYVKAKSKQDMCSEGDIVRAALDEYIKKHPLKKKHGNK